MRILTGVPCGKVVKVAADGAGAEGGGLVGEGVWPATSATAIKRLNDWRKATQKRYFNEILPGASGKALSITVGVATSTI
jgi:hypothetical protein